MTTGKPENERARHLSMGYAEWFQALERAADERFLKLFDPKEWADLWAEGLSPDAALDRADEEDAKLAAS